MRNGIFACLFLLFCSQSALAHGRHHARTEHHTVKTDVVQEAQPWVWNNAFQAAPRREATRARYSESEHHRGGISAVRLSDGQTIYVASAYADRFKEFFEALRRREGRLAHITCLASGHMPNSLHHWGGACDVGQTARNVAWRAMYHVGALASEYGLTDGCIWSHPDCGHVDVSGVGGRSHYARHRYAHYAHRYRRHYAKM